MIDLHNSRSDSQIKIDKAGFVNIKHPISVKTLSGDIQTSIGIFDLCVGVLPETRGVNMSRFISVINKSRITEWNANNVLTLLKDIDSEVGGHGVFFKVEFDHLIPKEAPVSKNVAFMPYKIILEASLNSSPVPQESYDYILSVIAVVKSLCPCSKAISDYSAHNQRNYVRVSVRLNTDITIEEIIGLIEQESSCPIYPIVKRVDEKYMTETAYDNPKFAEDVVRGLAERLLQDARVRWFHVSSRAEDSILPYDAYAEIESCK